MPELVWKPADGLTITAGGDYFPERKVPFMILQMSL